MIRNADDQYAHLRTNAAAQKQTTIDRLSKAIAQLEAEGRPVNTFTLKEVSGMDYMAYYRNRDAFQLFQEHSTHLRKKRKKEQERQKGAGRGRSQGSRRGQVVAHEGQTSPPSLLFEDKQLRLMEQLREAQDERDEARRQLKRERMEAEQRAKAEQANWTQRYYQLLEEHMQCGVKTARLEAELAQFKLFLERYRSSLQRGEQG